MGQERDAGKHPARGGLVLKIVLQCVEHTGAGDGFLLAFDLWVWVAQSLEGMQCRGNNIGIHSSSAARCSEPASGCLGGSKR